MNKLSSNKKAVRLSSEKEADGHSLGPAVLYLSPHQSWVASVGRDGLLCIHDFTTLVKSGLEQLSSFYTCSGVQCADVLYWSVSIRRHMYKSSVTLGGWEEFALCLSVLIVKLLSLPAPEMALSSAAGSGKTFGFYVETANFTSIVNHYLMFGRQTILNHCW